MAAIEQAHIKIKASGPEAWEVELNGHRIESQLAPGGLQVFANDANEPGAKVVLTFVNVELDADLEGIIIDAVKKVDRPAERLRSEVSPDGEFWSYRVLNPDGTIKVSGRASTKGQAQGFVFAAGGTNT